ncbi:Zinc ion binding [Halocaridina rubra]|uniref:Zinc ion binding n=1 Tax=Halocaridina rubra TaxID=373956 RepID=A0AAN8ZR94_HALRR
MNKESQCWFCGMIDENELELGSLHVKEDLVAHFFCMLFSSGLPQNGDDEEGILGFLIPDILKELQRGKKLSCSFCSRKGATIGCSEKKCRRSYHYGCGLRHNCLFRFTGDFRSYCGRHREYQHGKGLGEKLECPICMDELIADPKLAVWAPCCNKKSWFHKMCIQQLAVSAGYFFKCPLCNDRDIFVEEMQKVGIYVPEKDASWELEPNAYIELERPVRCDAKICRCPEGRKLDDIGTRWEILLCNLCGSSGIHITCGKLPFTCNEWNCSTCLGMLDDSMKRLKQEERDRRHKERNARELAKNVKSVAVYEDDGASTSCGVSVHKDVAILEGSYRTQSTPKRPILINEDNLEATSSKRRFLEMIDRTTEATGKSQANANDESIINLTYASDSDEEIDVELGEYPVPPHTVIRELVESGEELCKPLEKLKNYAVRAQERMQELRLTEKEIFKMAKDSPSFRHCPIDKAMILKFFHYNLPLEKMLQVLMIIRAVYSLREALVASALSSKKKTPTSSSKIYRRYEVKGTPDIKVSFSKSALSETFSSASLVVRDIYGDLEQNENNKPSDNSEGVNQQPLPTASEIDSDCEDIFKKSENFCRRSSLREGNHTNFCRELIPIPSPPKPTQKKSVPDENIYMENEKQNRRTRHQVTPDDSITIMLAGSAPVYQDR